MKAFLFILASVLLLVMMIWCSNRSLDDDGVVHWRELALTGVFSVLCALAIYQSLIEVLG